MEKIKRLKDSGYFYSGIIGILIMLYYILLTAFSGYGIYSDEFYFLDCSNNLSLAYINQPSFSANILLLLKTLLGHSIWTLRILPIFILVSLLFLSTKFTKIFGGGERSILLTSISLISIPILMMNAGYYNPEIINTILLSLLNYYLIKLINENTSKYFINIGVLAGLSLQTCYSSTIYLIILLLCFLCSQYKHYLKSKNFLLGLLFCSLIIFPNIYWQIANNFPSFSVFKNLLIRPDSESVFSILMDYFIYLNPFNIILWIIGIFFFEVTEFGKKYRFFANTFLVLFIYSCTVGSDKIEIIIPMLIIMLAGGAVAIEKYSNSNKPNTMSNFLLIFIFSGFVVFTPVFTPLLSPSQLRNYITNLGLNFDNDNDNTRTLTPKYMKDNINWKDFAYQISKIYGYLDSDEQKHTAIITPNYQEAAALNYYKSTFKLPLVYSTQGEYIYWIKPPQNTTAFICISYSKDDLDDYFNRIDEKYTYNNYTTQKNSLKIAISIARDPKVKF